MTDRHIAASPLSPGLYLVSTPIGAARDITLRALDILAAADMIAAEDTRTARRLMEIHGIARNGRPVIAYHDHSGDGPRARVADAIAAGQAVAYVSEAGTPLIADPGFALARAVTEAGGAVLAAPGASAVLAALAVAGLPTDRFMFAGFLPPKAAARDTQLAALTDIPATLVFYEAPKRMPASLAAIAQAFGPERPAAICRELTKKFEQVSRGPLGELGAALGADIPLKGEFVIVVGPPGATTATAQDLDIALLDAMEAQSVRDAATEVAEALNIPRKRVYARALELKRG